MEICNAGAEWRWGEVLFEILSPTSEVDSVTAREGNNSSCVLRIRWRDIQLLLPGDIESATEYQLLDSGRLEGLQLDLLVAPHHGSKTSSTAKFVQQLAPKHVVFSAGYQHQFGHPHSSVTKRYSAVGSRVWNTAEQGAITFEWLPSGEPPERAGWRTCWRAKNHHSPQPNSALVALNMDCRFCLKPFYAKVAIQN